jgi:hypothetical protein
MRISPLCFVYLGGAAMKREALIRELREIAKRRGMIFEVSENRGKGSHYRVRLGDRFTNIKSGEMTGYIRLTMKQLDIG